MHVAWGIDSIDQVFNDLKGKGNEMRGDGPSTSPYGYKTASIEPSSSPKASDPEDAGSTGVPSGYGYKTASIEPSSSHGIYFQLAEGEHS